MTHIGVSKLTITGPDNDLSPGRRQAIIWNNAGILLIGPLGTNFSEILIKINTFSLKKMHLKMSSGRRQPSCLGLNVLTTLAYMLITEAWILHVYMYMFQSLLRSSYESSHPLLMEWMEVSRRIFVSLSWYFRHRDLIYPFPLRFENCQFCIDAIELNHQSCAVFVQIWLYLYKLFKFFMLLTYWENAVASYSNCHSITFVTITKNTIYLARSISILLEYVWLSFRLRSTQ